MSATVKREFMEEAGNLPTEEEQARCSVLIDTLFSDRKASLGHSPPPFAPSRPSPLHRPLPRNLKILYEGTLSPSPSP